jgi:hypothetical protein
VLFCNFIAYILKGVAILKQLNKSLIMNDMSTDIIHDHLPDLPEKAIQFGGDNFLRGFIAWLIHELNNSNYLMGKWRLFNHMWQVVK